MNEGESIQWRGDEGDAGPELVTIVPGPVSRRMGERLGRVECAGITWVDHQGEFPVFWERALGTNVWDVDGNRFVDLTSAFGVAAYGHAHPELVQVAASQSGHLMHGMGDVHPPRVKLELLERLAKIAPGGLGCAVLGLNGADVVEAALKAAFFHTGKAGVISFEGGYHGLLGLSLESVGHSRFREPFRDFFSPRTTVLPFPYPLRPPQGVSSELVGSFALEVVEARMLDSRLSPVGAVLVEPIQARGGDVVPPPGFLRGLRELCSRHGALLIADEIYTGFGRTGALFACEHEGVTPDLLLLGKALTGGVPLSACLGRPEVMQSWPRSTGEALHTSTFLGHPVACAVALRAIELVTELRLPLRADRAGQRALHRLRRLLAGVPGVAEVRGKGLLMGVELAESGTLSPRPDWAADVVTRALKRGLIVLPSGRQGNVISISPPLVISEAVLDHALESLTTCIREVCG